MKEKELDNFEMENVNGGSIPTTLINAVNNIIETLLELGEKMGSGIRRLIDGGACPIN